jgi:nucleoside-diphosphate-sugar epimerase
VGVNLCRALADAGAEVHGTARPGGSDWRLPALAGVARVHRVELADDAAVGALLAAAEPELVFHAADHSAYDRAATLRQVVADGALAMATVLDAAALAGVRRLVLLGSSLAYGEAPVPFREDHPLQPAEIRGASKAASSLLALRYVRDRGLPVTELRLFSVYGPWEPLHRLVPRAIRAALSGEELPLTAPGPRRDPIFVGDVAEACLAAACAPGIDGMAINVGSGREVPNEEIVRTVEEVVGRPVRTRPGAYPAHATDRAHWQADVARARDLLGWTPRHSLRQGIAATVPWVAERLASEAGEHDR